MPQAFPDPQLWVRRFWRGARLFVFQCRKNRHRAEQHDGGKHARPVKRAGAKPQEWHVGTGFPQFVQILLPAALLLSAARGQQRPHSIRIRTGQCLLRRAKRFFLRPA